MSELIRREDLENWLRTECYGTDTDDDKEYVIGRLRKELPTIAASPWHRVEDGLPPKATWVLTITKELNVTIYNIATVDAGGQWWTYSPQNILRELYGVRYWMPIEPPKEDA